jgi:hypothetical protein
MRNRFNENRKTNKRRVKFVPVEHHPRPKKGI